MEDSSEKQHEWDHSEITGKHHCLIEKKSQDFLLQLLPFLEDKLAQDYQVAFIWNHPVKNLIDRLAAHITLPGHVLDIPVKADLSCVEQACILVRRAQESGFTGVCVCLDMGDCLHGAAEPNQLAAQIEQEIDHLVSELPLHVICLFRCDQLPPEIILAALHAHASILIEGRLVDNLFAFPAGVQTSPQELVAHRMKFLEEYQQVKALSQKNGTYFHRLIEKIQQGIWETDQDGKIILVNQKLADMLGYPKSEIVGKHLSEFMIWKGEPDTHHVILDPKETSQQWELLFRRKDGSLAWMTACTYSLELSGGSISGLLGMLIDTTERNFAEEALSMAYEETQHQVEVSKRELEFANQRMYRAEASLDAIYYSSREIFMLFNPQFRLISSNLFAQEFIHSFFAQEITEGMHVSEILPSNIADKVEVIFQLVLTGEHIQQVKTFNNPSGEKQWFELSFYPVQIDQDGSNYIGVTGFDITERKRLDAAEDAAQAFAEALTQALSDMRFDTDYHQALGQLLTYFRRVSAFDQALLMLIEGDQVRVVSTMGFSDHSSAVGKTFPVNSRFFQEIMQTGQPVLITDSLLDDRFVPFYPEIWARSWAIVPMTTQQNTIGFLMMGRQKPGLFRSTQVKLAFAFLSEAALAIENANLIQQLRLIAITDVLTGAYTRRHLFEQAEMELDRTYRYHHPLSVIMFDIDYFKKVNDTYGHLAGDRLLAWLIEVIRPELRRSDIIGRYGGEEFIILLPETNIPEAYEAAERIRNKVKDSRLEYEGHMLSITISLGVASCDQECPGIDTLFDQADQAMYAAKQSGRNRTKIWQNRK